MNLARSTLKLLFSKITSAAIIFVGGVLFARLIGSSGLGSYFLFIAVVSFLSLLTDAGIQGAVEKRISEGEDQGEFFTTGILMKIFTISATCILVVFLSNHIDNYIGGEVATLLIISIILYECGFYMIKVINAELRPGDTAPILVLKDVTWISLGYVLIMAGYDFKALIVSYIVGHAVMLVIAGKVMQVSPKLPRKDHFVSIYEFARHNAISNINWRIYDWMDVLIIGVFLTQSMVGAYEIAWQITGIMLLSTRALRISIFPQISAWAAKEHYHKIEDLIPTATVAPLIIAIPGSFGILALNEEILGVLYGPEFLVASVAIVILAFEKNIQVVFMIFERTLLAIDQTSIVAKSIGVSTVINVILNFALIPPFGIKGAALATLIYSGLNTIILGITLNNTIQIDWPFRSIGWICLSSSIMLVSLTGITRMFTIRSEVSLFATILFGGLVYVIILVLDQSIREGIQIVVKNS